MLEADALAWVVRTSRDPLQAAAVIRVQIEQSIGVPVTEVAAMRAVVSESVARQRASALLMSVLAGAALLLTSIGVYGLVACSVLERTRDIGIRMALGAPRGRIVRMVVRHGVLLAAIGVSGGVAAAYFLANFLASMLYGVEPRDIAVYTAVPIVLAVVVLLAVSIPAYRASRVHPARALRSD